MYVFFLWVYSNNNCNNSYGKFSLCTLLLLIFYSEILFCQYFGILKSLQFHESPINMSNLLTYQKLKKLIFTVFK